MDNKIYDNKKWPSSAMQLESEKSSIVAISGINCD